MHHVNKKRSEVGVGSGVLGTFCRMDLDYYSSEQNIASALQYFA